jgi:hypothetical protein
MNSYGIRWLMPMVDKWFYADGLFIVDVWMLAALVIAVVWSRRTRSTRPAGIALAAVAAYIVANLVITGIGRRSVAARYPGQRIMVTPAPLVPWRREVVVEEPTAYRFASYNPFTGLGASSDMLPKGDGDPAVRLAKADPRARGFLNWTRFPFYQVMRDGSATVVRIQDARYGAAGWASMDIRLP